MPYEPPYTHELKSWVGLFEPLFNGSKTHDIRVLDREYKIGDICWVREFEPITRKYTGRSLYYQITYITSSKHQECAFSPNTLHYASAVLSVSK